MTKFIMAALVALVTMFSTAQAAPDAKTTLTQTIDGVVDQSIFVKAEELMIISQLGKLKNVTLFINSPGGSVFAGSVYLNAMQVAQARGARFKCYVPQLAASMAFSILAYCNERYAFEGALFLWHPPRVVLNNTLLTPRDAEILSRDLNSLSKRMAAELLERMPIERKAFWYHFNAETLHSTEELQTLSPGWIKTVDDMPGVASLIPGNGGSEGMYYSPSTTQPWEITYIWSRYAQ